MLIPIEHDRLAQLLMAHDPGTYADDAKARLEAGRLILTTSEPDAPWAQAALFAIAALGVRMFRGGTFVTGIGASPVQVGANRGASLRRTLINLGCRETGLPDQAFRIHVGTRPPNPVHLHVLADGWRGVVSPQPIERGEEGNVISGALAGALGVSEAFRSAVLGDLLACRRPLQLSAWNPAHPCAGSALSRLPKALWQIGLGNLGQAALFVLGLLPYPDRGEAHFYFQDHDTAGEENRMIQILTEPQWMGRKKVRSAAAYAEGLGFETTLIEKRLHARSFRDDADPAIALVGVDNVIARRIAADGRFPLVVDAGLGKTAEEIFDIRLLSFPGRRSVDAAWPPAAGTDGPPELNPGLARLVDEKRLTQCGAITLAGTSLGVPSTALIAACLQVGQVCRALATGSLCDFIDVTLLNPDRVAATSTQLPSSLNLPALSAV